MWQRQKFGDFIECLTRRIVNGAAQTPEVIHGSDQQKLAMSAGNQQHQIRKFQPIRQARRQCVTRQMVDPDQRQTARSSDALGAHHARQNAADQTRPGSHGDAVYIRKRQPGVVQGAFNAVIQPLRMGAGGDFGHDTAKRRVQRCLAINHRRQNLRRLPRRVAHHRRCRIIAAAFQTKKGKCFGHGPPVARRAVRR